MFKGVGSSSSRYRGRELTVRVWVLGLGFYGLGFKVSSSGKFPRAASVLHFHWFRV